MTDTTNRPPPHEGNPPMDYTDIIVEHRNHVAYTTINRPDKMNAFRGRTCDELIHALAVGICG